MTWITAGFFLFVLIAVLGAAYVFERRRQEDEPQSSMILASEPALAGSGALVLDLFRSIGENFPAAKREKNPYRVALVAAGYRWPSAVAVFYGVKFASALFFAGLLGIAALLYRGDASLAVVPMVCGLGVGFLMPDRILNSRVRNRSDRLRAGIPAALDLMVLGMEAGQSLDQALSDASRGLKRTHPELSAELAQLCLELRASSSRADSLRALGARNREPELRKIANLLIDSDRYGTSIAPALRSHTKHLRTRFRQRAQEKARKVGVKLIFPVFFLIFPSVLLVTLGPACIMMYEQLQRLLE